MPRYGSFKRGKKYDPWVDSGRAQSQASIAAEHYEVENFMRLSIKDFKAIIALNFYVALISVCSIALYMVLLFRRDLFTDKLEVLCGLLVVSIVILFKKRFPDSKLNSVFYSYSGMGNAAIHLLLCVLVYKVLTVGFDIALSSHILALWTLGLYWLVHFVRKLTMGIIGSMANSFEFVCLFLLVGCCFGLSYLISDNPKLGYLMGAALGGHCLAAISLAKHYRYYDIMKLDLSKEALSRYSKAMEQNKRNGRVHDPLSSLPHHVYYNGAWIEPDPNKW